MAKSCRDWARFLKSKYRLEASTRKMIASHLETIGVFLDEEEDACQFLAATNSSDE